MKLIKPSWEIIPQQEGISGIYKQIELVGRTCYKSEDKITEDSHIKFIEMLKNRKHCYTGNSEVLTENGWIKWENYGGERVAVINKDCSFKGYEYPILTIKKTYNGLFYEYPSMGIKVTEGHTMFGYFRNSNNDFYNSLNYEKFVCNESYKDNNGKLKTLGERMFKSPNSCTTPTNKNPYYELVGFWLGDGCQIHNSKNYLKFHLKKQRKIEYLELLCSQLNYSLTRLKNNYYKVESKEIGETFKNNYYDLGKIINDNLSPINIHSIIQGLINSDGSISSNTKTISFTNTSKSIIGWILRFAPLAGYNVTDLGVYKEGTHNRKTIYKILFCTSQYTINNDSRRVGSKVIITTESLPVYCVTVSTGLLLIRGDNKVVSICGNCAMLEHGTIYLIKNWRNGEPNHDWNSWNNKYKTNKYSTFVWDNSTENVCVTTNLRVLVENDWLDDLKYQCKPTDTHEKRIAVRFICDRGILAEFTRHRVFSFAAESTRYCNYSKDKFGNELTFIQPLWLEDTETNEDYSLSLSISEKCYFSLLERGWKPQQARAVLPNSLKTELIMTGTIEQWKGFFILRASNDAHPQARELAQPLHEEFKKLNLI